MPDAIRGTIAFTNDRPHVGGGGEVNHDAGIWVMDADGTGQRKVFDLTNGGWESCPKVSPDGTRIALRRFEPGRDDRPRIDGVWVVSLDDGRAAEVPIELPGPTEGPMPATCPVWSPDGTELAFATRREVWIVEADGGIPRAVPVSGPDRGAVTSLSDWSVDGTTLLGDDGLDVAIVDVETGAVERLGSGQHPTISPDGRKIAFDDVSPVDARDLDIWTMDVDGRNRRRFMPHPAEDAWPSWSPDGRYIAFSSRRDHYELVLEDDEDPPEAKNRQGYVPWERGYSGIYVATVDEADLWLLTPLRVDIDPWDWDATHGSWEA